MNRAITMLSVAAIATATSSAFAGVGIFDSFAIVKINGGTNSYYDLASVTANPDFQGANLGSFDPGLGNSLLFNGAQLKTFEDNGDVVSSSDINYRIYSGAPSGSFNFVNLPQLGAKVGNDRVWEEAAAGVNVLSGLLNGNYFLQVYGHASTNLGDQYVNNGGSNYAASFSVVPEPASLGLIGLGALGMLRRRKH